MKNTRLGKLIDKLERYLDELWYLDDDGNGECTTDFSKEDFYRMVMEDDEMHLLGTKTVKAWINVWYDNWKEYEGMKRILRKNGLI